MEKQTIPKKSCTFKHVNLVQMTIRWVEVKTSASEILTWRNNQLDKQWSRAERDKTTAATKVILFDVRSMKRQEARFAQKWSVQFYAISSDSEEANVDVGRICDKTGQWYQSRRNVNNPHPPPPPPQHKRHLNNRLPMDPLLHDLSHHPELFFFSVSFFRSLFIVMIIICHYF